MEHRQNVFILHKKGDISKVEMCLNGDITKRKNLFQFNRTSYIAAVMTVSDRYVVVKNPDTRQLIIYDFTSLKTRKTDQYLLFIQFLPDGNLLGVGEGKLQKYRIENGQLVELWTYDDIEDGYNLCTDSDKLIYVSTESLKKIYVVSSLQGLITNNTL